MQLLKVAALAGLTGRAAAVSLRSSLPTQTRGDMAPSLSGTANLEDTLMDLLSSDSGNTPELASFVKSIKSLVDSSMKPKILENKANVQSMMDKALAAISQCPKFSDKQASINAALADLQNRQAAYKQCRNEQAATLAAKAQCDAQQAALDNVQSSVCKDFNDFHNSGPTTCPRNSGESYRDYAAREQRYYAGQVTVYDQKKQACDNAAAAATSKKAECAGRATDQVATKNACDAQQDQVDGVSCTTRDTAAAACSGSSSCYDQALAAYDFAVTTARKQEVGLKTEWEAVLRLECLANVFAVADESRGSAITACKNTDHSKELGPVTLSYGSAPAKPSCAVPDGLAGSSSYANFLSSMPTSAPSKPCACCGQAQGQTTQVPTPAPTQATTTQAATQATTRQTPAPTQATTTQAATQATTRQTPATTFAPTQAPTFAPTQAPTTTTQTTTTAPKTCAEYTCQGAWTYPKFASKAILATIQGFSDSVCCNVGGLVNGDFEIGANAVDTVPGLPAGVFWKTKVDGITGWTAIFGPDDTGAPKYPPAYISSRNAAFTNGIMAAVSGNFMLGLKFEGSGFSQKVNGHVPGRQYTITFWAGGRPNSPTAYGAFSIDGVKQVEGSLRSDGQWNRYSYPYTASSSTIEFKWLHTNPLKLTTDKNERMFFVDAVSIQ